MFASGIRLPREATVGFLHCQQTPWDFLFYQNQQPNLRQVSLLAEQPDLDCRAWAIFWGWLHSFYLGTFPAKVRKSLWIWVIKNLHVNYNLGKVNTALSLAYTEFFKMSLWIRATPLTLRDPMIQRWAVLSFLNPSSLNIDIRCTLPSSPGYFSRSILKK